jgi:hypothetical protein
LCTQVSITQYPDHNIVPIREQHGGDVDELARCALDREPAAVNDRPYFVDHDAPAECRLPPVACRLLTVACRLPPVACRLLTVACRLLTVDCRLLIVDC